MRLSRQKQPVAPAVAEPAEVAQAAKWTNGSRLGSGAVTVALVVALACGPAALATELLFASAPSDAASVTSPAVKQSALQQSTGSFAVGFVGAWLGATQSDSAALSSYSSVNVQQLPKTGFQFRNVAVVSEGQVAGKQLTRVVVAADVHDETIDKGDSWPRRYFEVAVSTQNGALVGVGLPAPVTGPATSTDAPQLGYRESLSPSTSAGKSVAAFLAAYLTGQGETEPYTAPTTSLPPIDPAPYADITVSSIQASTTPDEHPSDGSTVDVYVTVAATSSVGQQVTSTYAMSLRARADRWEVSAIGSVPILAESTTPTSSPTRDASQEGK